MACKCRICGTNDVNNPGDICELCAIGQDPYASAIQNSNVSYSTSNQGLFQAKSTAESVDNNSTYVPSRGRNRKVLLSGGSEVNNTDPYGNSIVPEPENSVQVYQAGQVPVSAPNSNPVVVAGSGTGYSNSSSGSVASNKNEPITSGITKNITVDVQEKSALRKLFMTLFKGVPYTLDNDITMFQIFPDYTGTSLNSVGNACDQVIVYGKLNAGAVAENNDVEVYGHRDSDNNIVAKRIVNKASGTSVTPYRVIPVGVIWAITLAVFAALSVFVFYCGVEGIIWAVVIILCLTNLPLIIKIIGGIFAFLFSLIRRM